MLPKGLVVIDRLVRCTLFPSGKKINTILWITSRVKCSPIFVRLRINSLLRSQISTLTGTMHREGRKTPAHRTRTTGRSSRRPVPIVRCLTLAGPGTVCTGRSDLASGASVASVEKHSRDFSKFSHRRNRKYALHFLEKRRIKSTHMTWHVPTLLSLHTLSIEVSTRVSSIIENQTRAFTISNQSIEKFGR